LNRSIVPRVAIIGGIDIKAIKVPLRIPIDPAKAIPKRQLAMIEKRSPLFDNTNAERIPTKFAQEIIERSIPPEIIGTICAIENKPSSGS